MGSFPRNILKWKALCGNESCPPLLRDYREPLGDWQAALAVETLVHGEGYHAGSAAELKDRLLATEAPEVLSCGTSY